MRRSAVPACADADSGENKTAAIQAAEKQVSAIILSPYAVILSPYAVILIGAKDLRSCLLSSVSGDELQGFFASLRMTHLANFFAAAVATYQKTDVVIFTMISCNRNLPYGEAHKVRYFAFRGGNNPWRRNQSASRCGHEDKTGSACAKPTPCCPCA